MHRVNRYDNYKVFGFSVYFQGINSNREKTLKANAAEYDKQFCNEIIMPQTYDGIVQHYRMVDCHHLGIPRSWLALTDIAIPNDIKGFPYKVAYSIEGIEKNSAKEEDAAESMFEKALEVTVKSLQKAVRVIREVEEFTYEVVEVSRGSVEKKSFFQIEEFIQVESVDALQESFSDYPKPSSNGGGLHDLFD